MFRATHKVRLDRLTWISVAIRGDYAVDYRGNRYRMRPDMETKQLIRKPLKTMPKGGKLAVAGVKLRKRRREYSDRRKAFLARPENRWCPVVASGVVLFVRRRQRTTDVHHKDGREGQLLLDESKWLAVCRDGHEWIHQHPNAARKMGWLI